MFRGRRQQGQEVALRVLCLDATHEASWPTEAPTAAIYASSGRIWSGLLPPLDKPGQVGLFGYRLFLNNLFTTGYYRVIYRYRVGSHRAMGEDSFEVIAGGDPDGSVIGLYQYEQPQGVFVMQQRDGGRMFAGANPRW